MMKLNLLLFLLFLGSSTMVKSQNVPIPSSAQLQWQDAELVAVFHYDLHVFDGKNMDKKKIVLRQYPIIMCSILSI
ncbi:MAG: hypothetical protein R2822_25130 [Spirosomataceae bacterium]